MPRYKLKTEEVEAFQLNEANLGTILHRIESHLTEKSVTVPIFTVSANPLELSFTSNCVQVTLFKGSFIVFDGLRFNTFTAIEFNKLYEEVKPPAAISPYIIPDRTSPPTIWPLPSSDFEKYKWNEIIVKD